MKLSQTLLFSGVSDTDCGRMLVCFHGQTRHYRSGDVILSYDGKNEQVGILESGAAVLERFDVHGGRNVLEEIREGEIFGESIAFSNTSGDAYSVRCLKDAEVLFIPMGELTKRCENACACHSQVVSNLLTIVSSKVMRLSERVELLSRRSIRERILYYFSMHAKPGEEFTLPCSLSSLADYLCVDRSAMTREIGRMREEGLIEGERRVYRILEN